MDYSKKMRCRKAGTILFAILAFAAFAILVPNVHAESGFFSTNCGGCHPGVATTCAGCHAHGVHSSSSKTGINLAATTNKTTYAPGEAMTVTLTGGYRSGWIRAILYNQNTVELKRSTGPAGTGGGAGFPITFSGTTVTAPTTPGTYTYKAAWYGNRYDAGSATFGGANWIPDAGNANHGEERVSTNSFTVSAPAVAPTITTASLPAGTVGKSYSQPLAATGGTTPYGWSVSAGTLPAGMSLSAAGVLGGIPTAAATSGFTVRVTDANGASSTKGFTVTINAAAATLSGIAIAGPASVNEGGTASYAATATWSDGSTTNVTSLATWSENSTFAAISAGGVLTASQVTASQAVTVSASYTSGGVVRTNSVSVSVVNVTATLSGIAIAGPASVNEGGTASYAATATWSDGSTSNVTSLATWSENSTFAAISAGGVLTASQVTASQAVTVSASYNGTNATKSVTITDAQAAPTLKVTVAPEGGATDVPVTSVVSGTAGDSTDISSVFNGNTFTLKADSISMSATRAGDEEHYGDGDDDSACVASGNVVGTIAYDVRRTTATFTPECKLAHARAYTASITPTAPVQEGDVVAAPFTWSFTTVAGTPDTDDDGVQDGEDDHPGDDKEATPPKSKGKGKINVSVKRDPGARLRKVTGISDTHSTINQAGKPAGYEFHDGLLDYEIRGIPPGGTVEVDLTFPEPVPAGSKVYMAGPAGFKEIGHPTMLGSTVTLTLTDGGAGDSDGLANGVIVDPVGVATPVASGGGSLDLSTGSSGGGCAVAPGKASAGAGAMAPMLLLLIGTAVRCLRKTRRRG